MSFYDPKIGESENLKHGVPRLLPKNLYLPETKFLEYPVKFDKPLLVVTFFYFLFFNYMCLFRKKICLLMLVKMKKALKDLTTAHFTKNMLRVRNMQILIFFYKICVFALKHISITNQEIM